MIVALYRLWPEVRTAALARVAGSVAPTASVPAPAVRELLRADGDADLGDFDMGVSFEGSGGAPALVSIALSIASSLLDPLAQVGADDSLPGMPPSGRPVSGGSFDDVSPDVPILALRAKGGWDAVAITSRDAWQAFTMAFLTKDFFVDHGWDLAWRHGDFGDLIAQVLGTHDASDVAGTCNTYGVAAAPLPMWQDENQHSATTPGPTSGSTGGSGNNDPHAGRGARLAETLQYAAIFRSDAPRLADAITRALQ